MHCLQTLGTTSLGVIPEMYISIAEDALYFFGENSTVLEHSFLHESHNWHNGRDV